MKGRGGIHRNTLTPEKFDPKITIHSNANLFSDVICNGLNE
jgi:hypothetical protein